MMWRSGQDGVVARRMMGEDDFGAWSRFDAEALGTDRHATIGANFDVGAQAPDKGPPGTVGHRAQH